MTTTEYGFHSTTDDVLEGIDLTGKTVIVTGGTSGIGFETARALAAHGADVTIISKSAEKGEKTAEELENLTGKKVEYGVLELHKFDTVKYFAHEWLNAHDSLHILINNAGIMTTPFGLTDEGYEMQFATNHLGHFLLTNLLRSALLNAKQARVVNVASAGHHTDPVYFDDIHFKNKAYSPVAAYGQSKTANVWFAYELNKRFQDKGIASFSLHPGGIQTKLGRHLTKEVLAELMAEVNRLKGAEGLKSPQQGAATSCWAATAPELEGKGGLYLANCNITTEGNEMDNTHASHAYDEAGAAKLWEVSNEMLGTDF